MQLSDKSALSCRVSSVQSWLINLIIHDLKFKYNCLEVNSG